MTTLCDRFLPLLRQLPFQRAPALRAAMSHGYFAHLDATYDRGRSGLFLRLDGWCGWVLHGVRIHAESTAELQPAIKATVDVSASRSPSRATSARLCPKRSPLATSQPSGTWRATFIS